MAADDLGRQWVGINLSRTPTDLVVQPIQERQGLFRDTKCRTDLPRPTDLGRLPPYNLHGEPAGIVR